LKEHEGQYNTDREKYADITIDEEKFDIPNTIKAVIEKLNYK